MEERVKYAIFLAVVILVSFSTAYITTSLIHPNSQSNSQASNSQATTLPSSNIIHPSFSVNLDPNYDQADVQVSSNQIIYNLTITYQYTQLNDGTNVTTSVDYGNFYPSWDRGAIVQAGDMPFVNFQIPTNIMGACSTVSMNAYGINSFVINPKLNVTDVSGYS